MNPRPPTHIVTYRRGDRTGRFTTWSAEDAQERAAAWIAAGFQVDFQVIEQPAIQAVLRAEAA